MIDKFKNNSKIKVISLLSAVVLWLYVMAVVDPEETRLIEDLPITINNMDQLKEKDLVIYPKIELKTDIYITGKLSNIQKIKKEDIHVYGRIDNSVEGPVEGNNKLYLNANISERVSHYFKNNTIIIPLEKVIQEKRSIDINIEGSSKDKIIDDVKKDIENVKISGPRTLVQQVQKVIATLDIKSNVNDFSRELKLTPVDENGKEVTGIELERNYVSVDVKLLKQKTVPIEMKFKENSNQTENIKEYKLSQNTITIKGKKDVVDKIDVINTKPIDLKDLGESTSKEILLDIPENIIVENKTIIINIQNIPNVVNELLYSKDEIQLRNNVDNMDISTLDIPESVKVKADLSDKSIELIKSDILLYIDLGQVNEEGKYTIKYETKYEFNEVNIEPSIIGVK